MTADNDIIIIVSQTLAEFLNTPSKLITKFDIKSENLSSFIDPIQLVEAIKGQHEPSAV